MAAAFDTTAWEYRMLTHDTTQDGKSRDWEADQSRLKELNALGSEGWELVAAVPAINPDYFSSVTYVFKRSIEAWK